MLKAIISKKDLSAVDDYFSCVRDILSVKEVLNLKNFRHHVFTNRFQHSLNVSYYNFKLCKLFKLNARAAARAGLLHDLFFYNRSNHEKVMYSYCKEHSMIAMCNASEMFSIDEREADMILNHMWPLAFHMPKYLETFIITIVDKFCAVVEIAGGALGFIGHKLRLA